MLHSVLNWLHLSSDFMFLGSHEPSIVPPVPNPATRVSNRCAEVYKPSSLLRSYIADTSALPMLELGLIPVVTTMTPSGLGRVWGARQLFERSDHRRVRGEGQRGGGEDSQRVWTSWRGLTMMMRMKLLLIRICWKKVWSENRSFVARGHAYYNQM